MLFLLLKKCPSIATNIASNVAPNAINKFERGGSGKGIAGKGFTLFISNDDINDIIKILKLLKDSEVLIDGVTRAVKHAIKIKVYFLLVC